MNIDRFAEYLQAEGLGTSGQSLFTNDMPSACEKGILIKIPLTGHEIDPELIGISRGRLQIIVRATTHNEGTALADQVMKKMTFLNREFSVSGVRQFLVHYCRPSHQPIRYPRSEKGTSIEWSINFDLSYLLG